MGGEEGRQADLYNFCLGDQAKDIQEMPKNKEVCVLGEGGEILFLDKPLITLCFCLTRSHFLMATQATTYL